ncbi:MAG: hypothetical protein GX325_06940 [Peptococcaceae bacterium]|nr:hypothetical protein [Peptococcaceae bacterium]
MPFTISALNAGNEAGTAEVTLSLSPSTALFSPANLVPGESVGSPQLEVANTGDVDVFYYIFADWGPGGTTTATEARILADRLNIWIQASPTEILYDGPISGLMNEPGTGRLLVSPDDDLLDFVVSLPSTIGDIAQNLDLHVDLVFVAQSSPQA